MAPWQRGLFRALWDDILARGAKSKAPALLHKDLDITLMATRDVLPIVIDLGDPSQL
ncbi:MAG: hypothetical protein IV100_09545 [Myxococcales bacterium]|nr:hypothetical protein [Myxococcales bacterium]